MVKLIMIPVVTKYVKTVIPVLVTQVLLVPKGWVSVKKAKRLVATIYGEFVLAQCFQEPRFVTTKRTITATIKSMKTVASANKVNRMCVSLDHMAVPRVLMGPINAMVSVRSEPTLAKMGNGVHVRAK